MEAKFQKITLEDFDVEALRRASRKGYLYLSREMYASSDQLKEDIISYVGKIEGFVKPQFKDHYIDLWNEILNHPEFPINGFCVKKGDNKGRMNKRKVFAVVRRLNDACKIYSILSLGLAKALEGTMSKPSIYTSSSSNGSYSLTWIQMQTVARIVERYKRN